ncbi:MAG: hypothetical protein JWQ94_4923 [Tardiphaga sp.]|jgi:hypothetical protein|nr:hypothetical protein [Tardiphaga sp.]
MSDDLTAQGMIFIGKVGTDRVFYWLTLSDEPGTLVAEGCITGSEDLMRKIEVSEHVVLQFDDGPTFSVTTDGGTGGSRWVKLYTIEAVSIPRPDK